MLSTLLATGLRRRSVQLTIAFVAVAALSLVAIPGAWTTLSAAASGDRDSVRDALLGFGALAPAASIALNVVQGVLAPIPGFVVPFINGVVFGTWWGALITWVGGIGAAAACFAISRTFGRGLAERLCGRSALLARANTTVERHGLAAVVLARLAPGMPFDAFSYVGGLTSIRFAPFITGTAIGSAPHAFLYALLGDHLAVPLWMGLAITPLVGLLMVAGHAAFAAIRRRLTPELVPAPQPA